MTHEMGSWSGGVAPVLAAGLMLVSWYKPLLALVTFAAWGWVVSTIYDKDAARWYLPREMWNLIHMAAGIAAFGVLLAAPMSFWILWPVAAGILVADLVVYFIVHNADSRVPDSAKWTFNLSNLKARAEARAQAKQARIITLQMRGPKGAVQAPDRDSPEYEVRVWAEELLEGMIDARGIQLDIVPSRENQYAVTFMVDGVRKPVEQFHATKAVAVIDFFKRAAGLDTEDRRRRQSGDFEFGKTGAPMTPARVSTQGDSKGMRFSLLISPESQVARPLEELGMLPNQIEELRRIVEQRQGVVLLAAPPDNGRTSTLYAILRTHDAYTSNVQSVELEPQAAIEGVRQNRFNPSGDAEYSTTVRSILRRDPDVVGVAEMPDETTAKEAARADHERTRVYLCIKADGALQAIQLYARAVGDQKLAANSLYGVVAQRLVRQLCVNCRTAFQPTPEMLKKLGLPKDTKQLYRKGGQVLIKDKPQVCPVCQGEGFFGQTGIFEVHSLEAEQRKLIAGNDMTALRATFRQKKQQSMQQAALQHVALGNTSVEEVVRVTQSASRPSGSGSAGSGGTPGGKPASARPAAPSG